ncbi:Transcription factor SOX-6, partial [Marasmius crinis-equi]
MPRKGKQPERNDREKNDSNEQPPPKPRTNKDEDGNHIKRPLNAFVLWAQARRPVLMGENPGVLVPKISPLLGKEWRLLPAEEKALWRKKQQEEKERHAEANPDYVYQPRSSAQVQADKNRRGGNKNKRKAQESEDGEDEKVAHVPASARPRKRSRKAKVAVNKP